MEQRAACNWQLVASVEMVYLIVTSHSCLSELDAGLTWLLSRFSSNMLRVWKSTRHAPLRKYRKRSLTPCPYEGSDKTVLYINSPQDICAFINIRAARAASRCLCTKRKCLVCNKGRIVYMKIWIVRNWRLVLKFKVSLYEINTKAKEKKDKKHRKPAKPRAR